MASLFFYTEISTYLINMRELVPIKQPTQSTRLNAMTIIRPIHKNEYLCSNAVWIGMRSSTTVDSRVQPADNYKTSSLHRQKKNYILCINISSFGCFTILVHRNVKLLYKYVGPLASRIILYIYWTTVQAPSVAALFFYTETSSYYTNMLVL